MTRLGGLFIVAILCLTAARSNAQSLDLGIDLGASGFLGDLGGSNYIGRPFFFDLESSLTKPAASFHLRYYGGYRFGVRGSFTYTQIAGDDALIEPTEEYSPEWYRWYRNLSFQSTIVEGSVIFEFDILRYSPGSIRKGERLAPYILTGAGVFHFNPKAKYNGSLVELQPLHTEGQGFDSIGRKEYSLTQPMIPIGIGLRYNLSPDLIFGVEYRNNLTFTDYIDDVSTTYVAQEDFNNYFQNDPSQAQIAYDISMRADELSSYSVNQGVTAPGQQRGDPTDKDNYIFFQVSFSYLIYRGSNAGSGSSKSGMIFPHKIWNQDQMFKKRKKL